MINKQGMWVDLVRILLRFSNYNIDTSQNIVCIKYLVIHSQIRSPGASEKAVQIQ